MPSLEWTIFVLCIATFALDLVLLASFHGGDVELLVSIFLGEKDLCTIRQRRRLTFLANFEALLQATPALALLLELAI